MHELISHPGLQFYVFRLLGKLTYTLTTAGRSPRNFELHESDFEDTEGLIKEEESLTTEGTEASAVGLKLTIIKNTGRLQMNFEGSNGGSAAWGFDGLGELGRPGKMYATAAIQTSAPQMVDGGVQTTRAIKISRSTQTEKDPATPSDEEVGPDIPARKPMGMVDAGTVTNIRIPRQVDTQYLYVYNKRKSKAEFSDANPKKKRTHERDEKTAVDAASSTSDNRYLFLWGYKREPILSKNYGALRISLANREVVWQERSGDYPWKWEKWECNIDLRDPKLNVQIVNIASDDPKRFNHCNKSLQLTYLCGYKIHKRLTVQFLGTPNMFRSGNADGIGRTKITDVKEIVLAIETCIKLQSEIPLEFWHRGGSGIAVEPGSIVRAGG